LSCLYGAKTFQSKKSTNLLICLSKNIIRQDVLLPHIRLVAGVDVSCVDEVGVGAIAVLDPDSLKLLKTPVAIPELLL